MPSRTTAERALSPVGRSSPRGHNLSVVLRHVAAAGEMSRAALAAETRLGRATVSSLVEELLAAELLQEHGPANLGRVGRPGSILAMSSRGSCGVGLEINVDYLEVCVLDLAGTVRYRAIRAHDNRGRPSGVLRKSVTLVRRALAQVGEEGLRPVRLGVAVPGIIEPTSGLVRRAPNLGWEGIDAAAVIGRHLGEELPVTVDNEANLAALAELHHGQAQRRDNFVLVSGEVGIGAGIVVNGQLFRGVAGGAGELGHVPVSARGPACSCGGRGCLEQFAGQEALLRAAGLEVQLTSQRHPESAVALLSERARTGDRKTLASLARAGRYLGTGIGIVANIFAPEAVVLAGIFAPLSEWLLEPLETTLGQVTSLTKGPQLDLIVSALGPDAASMGAASLGVLEVLERPERARSQLDGSGTRV